VASFFSSNKKGFGLLMAEELQNGQQVLQNPSSPFVAIVGGAKVSDKIPLIQNLIPITTDICIGGGMAYTFLKARGYEIGQSLCEADKVSLSGEILKQARDSGCNIHLPVDSVIANEFSASADVRHTEDTNIPESWMGLDIGLRSIELFSNIIRQAKTIIWNGPMGVFEFEAFSNGTYSIAKAVAEATQNGAYSLIGGGDSVSAINKSGLSDKVSFISTGGGAMLELLEGKKLPGVEAIQEG
jgi:phosphoglycerate kinase